MIMCCAGSLPAACASCLRPSAGAAAAPSPALAVCSAYNGASCCDLDAELSFTLSVARSRYADDAACYSEMLDAHCGVECHAEQDAFTDTGTSEVRVCASWCTALHATCGGLDDVEESCTASVTDPVTTCTLNPGVDCSVASGAGTCTRVAPDRSAGSDLASDVWCGGLTIFPWTGTHSTVVVADADHVGACWGGIALDGCDGVPNSGKVFDSCGVCDGDGSSCTVPGAATVAALNSELTTALSDHQTDAADKQTALGTWATNQNTRVTDEQARAASEHATKLGATSAARTQLIADMAAKDTAVTDHTAAVTAALSAAQTASSDAMTALGDDMTASQNAINTDYARVQTAHESQTAVSEAMLAREMAAWQSTHDDTVAEIARLKAAP